MKSPAIKEVREKLNPDTASCRGGVYLLRWGFFYTMGKTAKGYEEKVKAAYPAAVILDSGEVWKPFRGGAGCAAQSHFYVKFTVPQEAN